MELQLAQFIKKAVDHCGGECEIRENYSGRGMSGQTTTGIVVDNQTELLLNVISYIREGILDNHFGNKIDQEMIDKIPDTSNMSRFRSDNMGRQIILY